MENGGSAALMRTAINTIAAARTNREALRHVSPCFITAVRLKVSRMEPGGENIQGAPPMNAHSISRDVLTVAAALSKAAAPQLNPGYGTNGVTMR